MECVAYLRVSTDKQAEEGNGLDSQKRDILSFAGKNRYVIKEWYVDDGYTGSNMNRPQLQRLINDCYSKKIKTVIAFKLDRLSRNMVDGLYIIEKIFLPNNVEFKCVHDSVNYDSPMEQAYTQMMAVFAQLDKNTMMLRMRGGMLERVKKGYWMGGGNLPYCYSYNKETGILEIIPEKAEKARNVMNLYLQGWSLKRIQKTLGIQTERTVYQILNSQVNLGMIPFKGELYKGLHEPIFTQEEYDAIQKMQESRKQNRSTQSRHLLSGMLKCGVCGCSMRYQLWGTKLKIYCYSRNKDKDYIPNHNRSCTSKTYDAPTIEKQVIDKILDISLNLKKEDFIHVEDNSEIIEKEILDINSKLKRLYMRYADGNDAVVDLISELEERLDEAKNELKKLEKTDDIKKKRLTQYNDIKKIADVWEHIDKKNKNNILKSIINSIYIVNDDITIELK